MDCCSALEDANLNYLMPLTCTQQKHAYFVQSNILCKSIKYVTQQAAHRCAFLWAGLLLRRLVLCSTASDLLCD